MRKIKIEEYLPDGKAQVKGVKGINASDKEIFKVPLENQSVAGKSMINFSELKKIDNICTKIDEAKGELLLEETEYDYLKKKFNEYPAWNASKNIRSMVIKAGEKIENAEQVKVKEEKNTGGDKSAAK